MSGPSHTVGVACASAANATAPARNRSPGRNLFSIVLPLTAEAEEKQTPEQVSRRDWLRHRGDFIDDPAGAARRRVRRESVEFALCILAEAVNGQPVWQHSRGELRE